MLIECVPILQNRQIGLHLLNQRAFCMYVTVDIVMYVM